MNSNTPIGVTNFQSKQLPFGIKKADRAGHIYCIGKTGTGKSTLLLNMAIHDIRTGEGVGIIDPHGDIAESILQYIPKHRIKDVIYFNTTDTRHPIGFNPLYKVPHFSRHTVTDTLVGTFKKLWSESWGPRLEHILRNTIQSLTYYPKATLLDITKVLTDFDYRKSILTYIKDAALLSFWYKEFEPLSPQMKQEVISPIVNKVGIINTHPILKNILGQSTSSFSISYLMNRKMILIANLSKGYLGEAGSTLLGSLLVTQFQSASLGRARLAIEDRHPFYLYIDEMHSFMTLSFADILSESRKYGLSLFLTHQFTGQLEEPLLKAILGNTGTLISFRVGVEDALLLKDEFHPVFTETDILNLPQYHIYLKLLIDGTTSQPFSATTKSITAPLYNHSEDIITHTRKRYSIPPKGDEPPPYIREVRQNGLFGG